MSNCKITKTVSNAGKTLASNNTSARQKSQAGKVLNQHQKTQHQKGK